LAEIKGQKINLVEFSVSHYLLARALETKKLVEKDIKVVNTSDADLAAAYKTSEATAVVTWNPIVSEILGAKDANKVFDSSQIPGEIMDLMVANTAVVKENPNFARALVGIWYETITKMNAAGADGKAAKEAMAKASGTDLAGFDSQLASTKLFDKPRKPSPRARLLGQRWTACASSFSKRNCSERARSPLTPLASNLATSRCLATRPT